MNNNVLGLHHITAIAGNAQRNFDFYTHILGLKFVKKTVNFDDPHTYHFYYGNYNAEPGSILTFFPMENISQGRKGSGQATEFGFSIPEDSLHFWLDRFEKNGIIYNKASKKMDEQYITVLDPDGLKMELTATKNIDFRKGNTNLEISENDAIKGFHSTTLTLNDIKATADILINILDYKLEKQEVNRYRFINENSNTANIIDLVELPNEKRGHVAGGSVHHVAFRVKDDETQMKLHQKLEDAGLNVTEQIDRNYFHSLYFREPGGVLFEIATDNPGFTVDEAFENLGKDLKLPNKYESMRGEIEKNLPSLK